MHTTQEFNDLVVREEADRIIRLSDVGAPNSARRIRAAT